MQPSKRLKWFILRNSKAPFTSTPTLCSLDIEFTRPPRCKESGGRVIRRRTRCCVSRLLHPPAPSHCRGASQRQPPKPGRGPWAPHPGPGDGPASRGHLSLRAGLRRRGRWSRVPLQGCACQGSLAFPPPRRVAQHICRRDTVIVPANSAVWPRPAEPWLPCNWTIQTEIICSWKQDTAF